MLPLLRRSFARLASRATFSERPSLAAGPEHAPAALFESLEPRAHFAGDFASVGMRFETFGFGNLDGDVFISEGFIDDSLSTFGDVFSSGPFDRRRVDTLPYDFIEQTSDGRYIRHPNRGSFGTPLEANGARFLDADGFPVGWWYGDFGGGDKEAEFIVERPSNATFSDFVGEWRFSMLSMDLGDEDFDTGYGVLSIDFDDVRFLRDAGRVPHTISAIDVVTDRGRLTTTAGEYFYLNKDGTVMIFADVAENDGTVSIGVAVRTAPALTRNQLIGGYLLQWAFSDAPAADGPNGEVDFRQRFLSLEADGDYRIWDLDDWDSGLDENEYAISRGFWRLSGDRLILERRDSDDVVVLAVGSDASTLLPLSLDDGGLFNSITGLATRAFPNDPPPPPPPSTPDPIIAVPARGTPAGGDRPLIYALGTDNVWEVVDLIRDAGGPAPTSDPVAWTDPKDGRAYAAAITNQGLILYSQPSQGAWTFRLLTTEIAAAQSIVSALSVMTSPDGLVSLSGLAADGDVVRYHQTGQRVGSSAAFAWAFHDLGTDLAQVGHHFPTFAGPLISYATSWGGLNIAGIEAATGTTWVVWWAPGQSRWTLSTLEPSAPRDYSPAPNSGPSVYLTPWGGINLAVIDTAGNIRVTWWVPGFGGNWRSSNLTTESFGPRLQPGSISTYVAPWGGLNIVGLDAVTNDVRVYWWSPERTSLGWAHATLTAVVPPTAPRLVTGPLHGVAAEDNSLNVFGYDDAGNFIRYYWLPSFGGAWQAQNLTAIAIDR